MKTRDAVSLKQACLESDHPAHDAALELTRKLERGELNLCGCVGSLYGEPYCPCEMSRRGLPPSQERTRADEDAKTRLAEILASGIFANRE